MEDELFALLYRIIQEEAKRRSRKRGQQFSDGLILAVAFWDVLHDRPMCWACQARHWHHVCPFPTLPSTSTLSRRLRTLCVQLLLEQVFYRLLTVVAISEFCLCRRIDSKPLLVGGYSKDRDARWGYAAGGQCRGYKMFCCFSSNSALPEVFCLSALNLSDQAGGMELIKSLQQLHGQKAAGYLLADSTHDTNPLHECAGQRGFQLLCPRKQPGTDLGHRQHSPYRLRSIEMLEANLGPSLPLSFGSDLYRLRTDIERDLAHITSFGGGLQGLPSWVRRPHRVTLWVIGKLIINALRVCKKNGLTP